jgi:seryl-tRNA synthetase
MEDLEQSTQDVSAESSSAPVESESSPKQVEGQDASSPSKSEVPFHEHPRFKELIQQRNEFSQRLQEYEKRFQEINGRIEQSQPKAPTPEAKLLERLKGIDPEFGSWAEQQHKAKAELEQKLAQFEQWKTQSEQHNYLSAATSAADRVKAELKVDPTLHNMYLKQIPMGTPVEQIPQMYKQMHESVNKLIENAKREALTSYSKEKTKDSSIPAPSKGASPKPGGPKFEYSKDPAEARAQVVKNALKSLKNQ